MKIVLILFSLFDLIKLDDLPEVFNKLIKIFEIMFVVLNCVIFNFFLILLFKSGKNRFKICYKLLSTVSINVSNVLSQSKISEFGA
jgi:hypothetical protein